MELWPESLPESSTFFLDDLFSMDDLGDEASEDEEALSEADVDEAGEGSAEEAVTTAWSEDTMVTADIFSCKINSLTTEMEKRWLKYWIFLKKVKMPKERTRKTSC